MTRRAFTLVELIAVLALVGIVSAIVGLLIRATVQRYAIERDSLAAVQKAEVVLARLERELAWATWPGVTVSDGGRTLRWTSLHPDRAAEGEQTLTWSGTTGADLVLGGRALVDGVQSFSVSDTAASGFVELQVRIAPLPQVFRVRSNQPGNL